MIIREIEDRDIPDLLSLNQQYVHFLSALDREKFTQLKNICDLSVVAEESGQLAGFILGMTSGKDYSSLNYQWFNDRYENFLYIDRVVVSGAMQGRGVASQLYEYASSWALDRSLSRLLAEINIQPENPYSLSFHQKFGFRELTQLIHDKSKIVSLQQLGLE